MSATAAAHRVTYYNDEGRFVAVLQMGWVMARNRHFHAGRSFPTWVNHAGELVR